MDKFADYIREDAAVRATFAALPGAHRDLVSRYDVRFEPGNTLRDDPGHVGRVYVDGRTITVAGPWRYGREFVLLHEVGHLVWDKLVRGTEWQKKWRAVYRGESGPGRPGVEEGFCFAYAQHFAKNKMLKFDLKPWAEFMSAFCEA